MNNISKSLNEQLFSDEDSNVFAVLDGASVPDLPMQLYEHQPEFHCLFRGELEPDIAEVAPYLVKLEPNTVLADWIIDQGWGKHWGIFAVSHADIRALRRHFRTFLRVYDHNARPLLFRYYDPRVLRTYLPTCNAKELETVFGPVEFYLLEDEDPNTILRFQPASMSLQQQRVDTKDTK